MTELGKIRENKEKLSKKKTKTRTLHIAAHLVIVGFYLTIWLILNKIRHQIIQHL